MLQKQNEDYNAFSDKVRQISAQKFHYKFGLFESVSEFNSNSIPFV